MVKARYLALALFIAVCASSSVLAQTLSQSTQDRQTIANLEYQANLPGTDAATRAAIQRQIAQLQYQINTRPLIEPMPTLAPPWQQEPGIPARLPSLNSAVTDTGATVYGSCDAERNVIAYLQQQVALPSTTEVEKRYDQQRLGDLQRALKSEHC